MDQPVTDESPTDEPVTDENPADEPVTDEQPTDDPVDEPIDDEPADEAPADETATNGRDSWNLDVDDPEMVWSTYTCDDGPMHWTVRIGHPVPPAPEPEPEVADGEDAEEAESFFSGL